MAKKKADSTIEPTFPEVKIETKKFKREWLVTVGWYTLLLAGLGHMFPTQMGPLLNWKLGVTVQFAIGVVGLVVALYYLLGNEE